MKRLLLILATLTAFAAQAQDLTGKLIFSFSNGVHDSIYALERDGHTISYVTEGFRPRVSHHGKFLAFSRNLGRPNNSYGASLYLRDLTTHTDSLIFDQNDYLDYYDFLPSDKRLVYSQICGVYSVNTLGVRNYTTLNCNPCDCYSDDPVIRIQDSLIVTHNVHFGLYHQKANGDSSVQIPHTYPGDLFPIFSPDGQWLAYAKETYGAYYVVNDLHKIRPDGRDSTKLTHLTAADSIAADPVWASDMQSLYIIARIGGVIGFYRVRANGTGSPTLMKELNSHVSIYRYSLGLADSLHTTYVVENKPFQQTTARTIPNPSSGITRCYVGNQPATEAILYDALGNEIAHRILPQGELDAATLPSGIYQLLLRDAAGSRATARLVRE